MWTGDLGIAWPDTKHHNVLATGYLIVTFLVGLHCLAIWSAHVRRAWRTGFAPDSVLLRALTHQGPSAGRLADDLILHLEKNRAGQYRPKSANPVKPDELAAEIKTLRGRLTEHEIATHLKKWREQQLEDAPPFLASALAAWLAFLWHGAVALLVTALWPAAFAPLFVVAYFVPLVVHTLLVALVGWGVWRLVRRYVWKPSQ